MVIETVEEIVDQVADWLNIYGACPTEHAGNCDACPKKENIFCSRIGFITEFRDRLDKAYENEKKLEQLQDFPIPPKKY